MATTYSNDYVSFLTVPQFGVDRGRCVGLPRTTDRSK